MKKKTKRGNAKAAGRKAKPAAGRKPTQRAAARPTSAQAIEAEYRHLEEVLGQMSRVGLMRRHKSQEVLDNTIWEELQALLKKIARLRSRQAPPPDDQWQVIMEIIALLLKLVFKAFWLQARRIPKIDPKLPNPSA